jgi:hypothetical protein
LEAFARNHHTPIVWAEKRLRKEDDGSRYAYRLTPKVSRSLLF